MSLKVEASSFKFFGYTQRKWWATMNLSNPCQVSCKDISVVISRVPYIRQNDWGQAVELFEVIKAGFTPFWFELRPIRIQRGEIPMAKRAPFSCRQSLLRVQSRGTYYE
jgi:hypothetical protein